MNQLIKIQDSGAAAINTATDGATSLRLNPNPVLKSGAKPPWFG